MRKEWISCNACGENDYKIVSNVEDWSIGKCGNCGLIYVNPAPFFEPNPEFSEISREFQYTRYMHQKITPDIISYEKKQLQANLEEIRRLTQRPLETVRFLDVGCGSGGSVRAAIELGWSAIGVDIDPDLIKAGIDQLQVDLRCSPLLESNLEDEQFDFIRLRDVIEHLPNPYETLCRIDRLLAPGGVVLFSTPNEDGFPSLVRRVFVPKRSTVATVPPPHHIHGFTPKTLHRLFSRVGFRVYRLGTTTPVDPMFVTSNNMRSAGNMAFVGIWTLSRMLGRGSMLFGWVGKVG